MIDAAVCFVFSVFTFYRAGDAVHSHGFTDHALLLFVLAVVLALGVKVSVLYHRHGRSR